MSRAAELFVRLKTSGEPELLRLIVDREPESLFLDFKLSPNAGAGPRLSDADNRNLSKAISGFGNSSGGVVVWGVDCRRNGQGEEVAQPTPLADAEGFRTKLESAISRATIPPHSKIETVALPSGGGPGGFVAMHIPQSNEGPLRAVATNHYHLRTGSAFEIIGHDVLAGMFGRHPRPSISYNSILYFTSRQTSAELATSLRLVAINHGVVMVERPCLAIQLGDFDPGKLTVNAIGSHLEAIRGNLPAVSVISQPYLAIPPGGALDICDLIIRTDARHPRAVQLRCILSADRAVPERFSIVLRPSDLVTADAEIGVGGRVPAVAKIEPQ